MLVFFTICLFGFYYLLVVLWKFFIKNTIRTRLVFTSAVAWFIPPKFNSKFIQRKNNGHGYYYYFFSNNYQFYISKKYLQYQLKKTKEQQKQPPIGVPRKKCLENMQLIYRRTSMPKYDLQSNFIEIALRYGLSPVNLLWQFLKRLKNMQSKISLQDWNQGTSQSYSQVYNCWYSPVSLFKVSLKIFLPQSIVFSSRRCLRRAPSTSMNHIKIDDDMAFGPFFFIFLISLVL